MNKDFVNFISKKYKINKKRVLYVYKTYIASKRFETLKTLRIILKHLLK